MQKKLLAVAVTGALAAMGSTLVQAQQSSSVQIYGTVYGEYAQISRSGYQKTDFLQNPGSELGIKGEEKIGGGMSVWFQCATTMDWRGESNVGTTNAQAVNSLCSRDSALGFKGDFGNVLAGQWSTPFKRVTNDLVGGEDTGIFGTAQFLYGSSSTFGLTQPINNTTISTTGSGYNTTTTTSALGAGSWRRRQGNLIAYDTPTINGITGMLATTLGNLGTGLTAGQIKPRIYSIGMMYNNGPLALGYAFEQHQNFYTTGASSTVGTVGSNATLGTGENAWALYGAYTLPNNLKVGAQMSQQTATTAVGATSQVKTYHVGIDWMFSGPHGVRAAYSHAGDVSGTGGATGTRVAPVNVINGATGNNGGSLYSIRYVYQLSKATTLAAGYASVKNSVNGRYALGGASTTVTPGTSASGYGLSVKSTF